MSEGYQRRPEERLISRIKVCLLKWQFVISIIGAIALWAANIGWMREMRTTQQLRTENAELTKQLDYWTCRVQFEPMPVPEQTNESSTPTLLPLEDR